MKQIDNYISEKLHLNKDTKRTITIIDVIAGIYNLTDEWLIEDIEFAVKEILHKLKCKYDINAVKFLCGPKSELRDSEWFQKYVTTDVEFMKRFIYEPMAGYTTKLNNNKFIVKEVFDKKDKPIAIQLIDNITKNSLDIYPA